MKPLKTAAVLGSGAVGSALLEELPRSGLRVLAAWTQSSATLTAISLAYSFAMDDSSVVRWPRSFR